MHLLLYASSFTRFVSSPHSSPLILIFSPLAFPSSLWEFVSSPLSFSSFLVRPVTACCSCIRIYTNDLQNLYLFFIYSFSFYSFFLFFYLLPFVSILLWFFKINFLIFEKISFSIIMYFRVHIYNRYNRSLLFPIFYPYFYFFLYIILRCLYLMLLNLMNSKYIDFYYKKNYISKTVYYINNYY